MPPFRSNISAKQYLLCKCASNLNHIYKNVKFLSKSLKPLTIFKAEQYKTATNLTKSDEFWIPKDIFINLSENRSNRSQRFSEK